MKVKELLNKINAASAKLPVYLQEGIIGEPRKATSFDFNGYPFDEQNRTIMSISLEAEKVIIYYK